MTVRNEITRFALSLSALHLGTKTFKSLDPQHRSIVVIDMADSGRRNDLAQLHIRASLDRVVRTAFHASKIPWHRLETADRGDGMIVFVPATVSKAVLLHPFIPQLYARLRDHNLRATPGHQIRARVAVHAGEVLPGPHGWVGTDLNLACRLVDSAPLYEALAHHPHADLALAVSDVIHRGVVRHGHRGIDPTSYQPVHVVVKEVDACAWIHTPAWHAPITTEAG
jgi:hypothetical protein